MADALSDLNRGYTSGEIEKRSRQIYARALRRQYDPIAWTPITIAVHDPQKRAYLLTLEVMTDALKMDGIRVNASHQWASRIGTAISPQNPARIQTSRIADDVWANADFQLRPHNLASDHLMGSTQRMIQHSRLVDAERIATDSRHLGTGIAADVGKDWINTTKLRQHPQKAVNYGWHGTGGGKADDGKTPIIQDAGYAHPYTHADYSQTLRFMRGPVHMRRWGPDGWEEGPSVPLDVAMVSGWLSYSHDPHPVIEHPQAKTGDEPTRRSLDSVWNDQTVAWTDPAPETEPPNAPHIAGQIVGYSLPTAVFGTLALTARLKNNVGGSIAASIATIAWPIALRLIQTAKPPAYVAPIPPPRTDPVEIGEEPIDT